MRLWSIHPRYLDPQGLVAAWREGLLAQKVLAGKTKGYRHHPQLIRFRNAKDPMAAIGAYLEHLALEATTRAYRFDRSKILKKTLRKAPEIPVTRGQLKHETKHLLEKLRRRAPLLFQRWSERTIFPPHPSFKAIPGGIELWEKNPVYDLNDSQQK